MVLNLVRHVSECLGNCESHEDRLTNYDSAGPERASGSQYFMGRHGHHWGVYKATVKGRCRTAALLTTIETPVLLQHVRPFFVPSLQLSRPPSGNLL